MTTRLLAKRPLLASLLTSLLVLLAGCPSDDDPPPDAAVEPGTDAGGADAAAEPAPDAAAAGAVSGLISIQDQRLHGAPQAGHGLSVRADFTAGARPPDFDEAPGELTGCKAWLYDDDDDPKPAALDQGTLSVTGTSAPVPAGCVFDGAAGYVCPVASGAGGLSVEAGAPPTARYDLAGAALGDDDVGRHVLVAGDAAHPGNDGRFPILALAGVSAAIVVNPAAATATYDGSFTVLAGGGAAGIPLDSPADPLRDDDPVVIGIAPGGGMAVDFPDTAPIDPGDAFELDAAGEAVIGAVPIDGSAFSVGCDGEGGRCGESFASIVQLETTDADLAGSSPFALPPAADKTVVIQCATLGEVGRVDIPAGATALLRRAHEARPITRVRLAFMRNGFALATGSGPRPVPVRVVVGHQIVGFTTLSPP
jgi:hypothetical protein